MAEQDRASFPISNSSASPQQDQFLASQNSSLLVRAGPGTQGGQLAGELRDEPKSWFQLMSEASGSWTQDSLELHRDRGASLTQHQGL